MGIFTIDVVTAVGVLYDSTLKLCTVRATLHVIGFQHKRPIPYRIKEKKAAVAEWGEI